MTNLPFLLDVQMEKVFQLQGGFAPLTPHQGLCPLDPRWGSPQIPVIDSRYRARRSRLTPTPNFVPTPLFEIVGVIYGVCSCHLCLRQFD